MDHHIVQLKLWLQLILFPDISCAREFFLWLSLFLREKNVDFVTTVGSDVLLDVIYANTADLEFSLFHIHVHFPYWKLILES